MSDERFCQLAQHKRKTRASVTLLAVSAVMVGLTVAPPSAFATSQPTTWSSLDGGQTPAMWSGLDYDAATQQTVMFGGSTGESMTQDASSQTVTLDSDNETWLWNGAAWSEAHPVTSPPARVGAAVVFDAASKQLLMFGGNNESVTIDSAGGVSTSLTVFNDTWSWDGATWTQLAPATSLPGRSAVAAAYDPATQQVVAFGGLDQNNANLADTWAWNGTTWRQLAPATSPPARRFASLAYDPTSKSLILFGGSDADGVALGDTWSWNGTTWSPLSPAHTPPSRVDAAMASAPAAGGVVLFGGSDADGMTLDDAWVWSGADWAPLSAAGTPPGALDGARATFDEARSQVVFVGGEDDSLDLSPTTWLLSVTAPVAVDRVAGSTRIATSIAIADQEFAAGTAKAVVLARSDAFPDALAGGPLAAHVGGPLLLTGTATLDAATKAEIQKLLPAGGTVYLLGGTAGLSPGVETALRGLGYQTKRLAGADRFATAVAIADAMGDPTTVFEASGLSFADALSGVPAAIASNGAILLTNGSAQASATTAYLAAHPPAAKFALGGPAAAADPSATPLAGNDRYATSALVASAFFTAPAVIGVATGTNYPDALAAGVLMGAKGGPLLLTPPTGTLPTAADVYLAGNRDSITSAFAFGGAASLSDAIITQVQQAISPRTS